MACKKRLICSAVCLSLLTGLLLFAVVGLEGVIDSVILEGVVLAPENIELWGQNPGKTNTTLLRNFTFFNLSNPREFLYRGQKPVFREFSGYLMQERSNFTNATYSPDRSYVDFNEWKFFTVLPHSRDFNESVHVLNLAPIGFWSQLDNIALPQLAIQGFGGLFLAINATIKMQAIGQGVQAQFLPNATAFAALCSQLQIEGALCDWLYGDRQYGLGDGNNYEVWVDFSYYNNNHSQFLLYKYFNLKRAQLQAFDRVFERWCRTVDRIVDNWYCGGHCENYDLAILQLSSSGLTKNPPSGDATDSVCLNAQGWLTQNLSCQGYPELYSFHKYHFPLIDNSSRFHNLTFSTETVRQLYSPRNGTLLNVGNLTRLFEAGNAYDAAKTKQNMARLRGETHGESDEHAVVIWEYAKYFAFEFILQSKDKGTKKIAGLGGVFSQALYQSFSQFADWILDELLAIKMAELLPDCPRFLEQAVELSAERAGRLCAGVGAEDYRSYLRLVQPCDNEYFAWQFKEENDLLAYEMGLLCNLGSPSILQLLRAAHADIAAHHHCRNPARCTGHQLGLKQFMLSNITRNPLKSAVKQHPESWTAHAWNPQLQEWEYRHFLDVAYGDPWLDKTALNDSQLTDLLSFDKLFNGPMVQNLTLIQDPAFFTRLFHFTNKTLLMDYIRFVTIEVGFGGFTQQRTVNELLFGYVDPFLQALKDMDPMQGGDPSIETKVALNEENATLEEAYRTPQSFYTGYSDPALTRVYRAYNGKDIVTYNHTYFDGYEVHTEFISPYKEPVPLGGGDAAQFKPMSTPADKQYAYLDSLYRVGELSYNRTLQRYGFDVYRYTISDHILASSEEYPPNANFYQSFSGLMNLSFMGLPVFASKNHFLDAKDNWADLVDFYDRSGAHQQKANEYDETEVVIQPKTGAPFTATIYLQSNVYLQQDLLFTHQSRMMPVMTIYRSGNITAQTADQLLGDLRTALGAPAKLILFCVFGIVFTVFATVFCSMKRKRVEMSSSLLSSTHEEKEGEEQLA